MRSPKSNASPAAGTLGAGSEDVFSSDTNVFVEGPPDRTEAFCTRQFEQAERAIAVAAPTPSDLGSTLETEADGNALVFIGPAAGDRGATGATVTIELTDRTLPALGDAMLDALEGEGVPPCDLLWFTGLERLVERESAQNVYKLLYVLGRRVARSDALGLYSITPSVDARTRRILGTPLDSRVTFDEDGTPHVGAVEARPQSPDG